MLTEALALQTALACYVLALLVGLRAWQRLDRIDDAPATAAPSTTALPQLPLMPLVPLSGALLWLALGLHTLALGLRWAELGHGPFTTLYEVISSNLWSLCLMLAGLRLVLPALRLSWWMAAAPALAVLGGWALVAPSGAGHLPPTYATPLLYVHAVLGKLYLGSLLAALALAAPAALAHRAGPPGHRTLNRSARLAASLGGPAALDELAHRCAAAAFIFDSLMLIVGACWAQDAWGRYWAWDPLETWAFLTWLALASLLHLRVTVRLKPQHHALLLLAVFVLAFLTFFGVPYLSTSPHKGAV